MTQPIDVVLIGAGERGANAYGSYALNNPDQLRFVAVAEPIPERRASFSAQHHIPSGNQYESWEGLLERPQLGRAALICTQDRQHTAPALAALEAGYEVLLEKPIATTPRDCNLLVKQAEVSGQRLQVCHVLRYTRHFQKMRQIIHSGLLGQIVNIAHRENVSYWHMAHSYVRGHWANRDQSSSMILAKCCHDFDILTWMLGRKCQLLSSVGSLLHFRNENAPEDAPEYCLDGCPAANSCPYYAPFIYIDLLPLWRSFGETATGLPHLVAITQQRAPGLLKMLTWMAKDLHQVSDYRGWPRSVVTMDPTSENLRAALSRGPYGRCVYHCDNNVVDHQVILMQFEGGLSVSLTMHGHSDIEERTTRIEGSRATLLAQFGLGGSWIEVKEHRSGNRLRYDTSGPVGGHGGGDEGLMRAFVQSLRDPAQDDLTTAQEALESHLMAFAAEQARLEGTVIRMKAFKDAQESIPS